MKTTIKYVLITALRDKLFIGLFFLMLVAIAISKFLGQTALVEQWHMTVSYVAGSTRLTMVVGLIVFICFHVRRLFEHREVEVILTKPISRTSFVVAYWLGFCFIATILNIFVLLTMKLFLNVATMPLIYWGASIFFELYFVVAFSLLFSLLLKSAVTSVMCCFGMYLVGRMLGFFTYILEIPRAYVGGDKLAEVNELLIKTFSMILPRIDLYGKSNWLIYGIENDTSYYVFLPQTFIYVSLVLFMAIYDFKRRQF